MKFFKSYKFIELCMEKPCWCPWESHQHGGRKVTETAVFEAPIQSISYHSRIIYTLANTFSNTRTVQKAKT